MPKKSTAPTEEAPAASEKDQIDKAFSNAAPAPDPESDPFTAAAPVASGTKAEPPAADEYLPSFQKVIHVPFTEAEFAERAKKMNAFDKEIETKEQAKKDFDAEINGEIKELEAQRRAVSDAVGKGGAEREITCRKRVNWDKSIAQVFIDDPTSPNHLEILEEKTLTLSELQVKMDYAKKERPKGNVVHGHWPEGQKVGTAEANADEPNWDLMNQQKDAEKASKVPAEAGKAKRGRKARA